MMTLKEIETKLQAMNLKEVSRKSGASYLVTRNAAAGKTINYEDGRKLAEFLTEQGK